MSAGVWLFLMFLFYALFLIALPVIAGILALRWANAHPYPAPGETRTLACRRCQQRYASSETVCPHCGQPAPDTSAGADVQNWSVNRVRLLGAAQVWPFAYMIIFFGLVLSMIAFAFSGDYPFWLFGCVIPLHFITIALSLGMVVFYIYMVVNSHEFDSTQRTMWIVALVLGGWIALLVAFIVFVWRPWSAAHPKLPVTQPDVPSPPRGPVPPVT